MTSAEVVCVVCTAVCFLCMAANWILFLMAKRVHEAIKELVEERLPK